MNNQLLKNMKFTINVNTKTLLADQQTPVGIYLKVRDLYPESALLESSDFHGGEDSYSFIAVSPMARFVVQDNIIKLEYPNGKTSQHLVTQREQVVEAFSEFSEKFQITAPEKNMTNGFFGYTAYDAVKFFDQVEVDNHKEENGNIPDMYYIFYKFILVINHLKNEMTIVENLLHNEKSSMLEIESIIANNNVATYSFRTCGQEKTPITDKQYLEMVEKGIAHCKRGDVFQIVLSRCFSQEFEGDEFSLYRTLRSINPSPYLFFFDFGSFRIFGSSPETHCRIQNGKAYIDPIAGTYRRTGDDQHDRILSENLLKDEKENAEHVMLVDLARNDLSRNCHHVGIEFFKHIQFYSHVIHLVSRVSGTVESGKSSLGVFADTFPAGTLSGAPKIRAMQLIKDIEYHTRGAYGGCIGYIGLNGDLNQAITIRSFLSKNNTLYYQAGAGVVSKSNPQNELQEVNNKLDALRKAIKQAENRSI